MIRIIKHGFLALLFMLFISCRKDRDISIKEDVSISPSYSLALGNFAFNINDYLSSLNEINQPIPDSLFYNDSLYPNPLPELTREEVFEFNPDMIFKEQKDISILMLRFIFYNGYPTEFTVQAQFIGEADNTLFTLPETPATIPVADIDQEGKVTGFKKEIIDIEIPDSDMDDFYNIRQVKINYVFQTQSLLTDKSRFYTPYEIKLHIGARIETFINP